MPRLTGTFNGDAQVSGEVLLRPNQDYYVKLVPTTSLTGRILLQKRNLSNLTFSDVTVFTSANTGTEYTNTTGETIVVRLFCSNLNDGEQVAYTLQSLLSGKRRLCDARAKVGTTQGWLVAQADNSGAMANLPKNHTNSTLVVRIDELQIGDTIVGYYPVGQVESGGLNATLTIELRKMVAAADDLGDVSVATTGAMTYAADTKLGRVTQFVDHLNVEVGDGESYYFLITGTTANNTDFALQGVTIQYRNGVE